MKVPVFVSCPTALSLEQEAARSRIVAFLGSLNLEPRALGRSDYPTEFPLREVYVIAKHCSGGVILGFEQLRVTSGINKESLNLAGHHFAGHTEILAQLCGVKSVCPSERP